MQICSKVREYALYKQAMARQTYNPVNIIVAMSAVSPHSSACRRSHRPVVVGRAAQALAPGYLVCQVVQLPACRPRSACFGASALT